MIQLVDESVSLMQQFHEPIQQSAAHIYVSAIPLTPSNTILFKTYASELKNIPELVTGGATSAALTVLRSGGAFVIAAVSPDCTWFVYAGDDRRLWICDVVTCTPIHTALEGHSAWISHIQFAHDGTRFCSLDEDGHLLVWDAAALKTIGMPIQLSEKVKKIHMLVDDKVIVQHDNGQICLWETVTGRLAVHYELILPCSYRNFVRNAFRIVSREIVELTVGSLLPNIFLILLSRNLGKYGSLLPQ